MSQVALRPERFNEGAAKLRRTLSAAKRPKQREFAVSNLSTTQLGVFLWDDDDDDALKQFQKQAHFAFLRRVNPALDTLDFYRRHWLNSSEDHVVFSRQGVTTVQLPEIDAVALPPDGAGLAYLQQAWMRHPQLLQQPFQSERAADDRQLLEQLRQQEPALRAIFFGGGSVRTATRTLEAGVFAFFKHAVERIVLWQRNDAAANALRHMDVLQSMEHIAGRPLAPVRKLIARHLNLLLSHLAETMILADVRVDLRQKEWTFDLFLAAVDLDANAQMFEVLRAYAGGTQRTAGRRGKSYLLYVSPTIATELAGHDDEVIQRRLQGETTTPFTLSRTWACSNDIALVYAVLGASRRNVLYVIEVTTKGRALAPVLATATPHEFLMLPGTQLTVVNARVMYHPLVSAIMLPEAEAARALMLVLYCQISGASLALDAARLQRWHAEQRARQSQAVVEALAAQQQPRLQKALDAMAPVQVTQWEDVDVDAVCLSERGVESRRALTSGTQLGVAHGRAWAWRTDDDDERMARFTTASLSLYINVSEHLLGQVAHQWNWPAARDVDNHPTWRPFFANTALAKRMLVAGGAERLVWVTTRDIDAREQLTLDHSVALTLRGTPEWDLQQAPVDLSAALTSAPDLRALAQRSKIKWAAVKF